MKFLAKYSELIQTRFWRIWTKNHNLSYFIQTGSEFSKLNAGWATRQEYRSRLPGPVSMAFEMTLGQKFWKRRNIVFLIGIIKNSYKNFLIQHFLYKNYNLLTDKNLNARE